MRAAFAAAALAHKLTPAGLYRATLISPPLPTLANNAPPFPSSAMEYASGTIGGCVLDVHVALAARLSKRKRSSDEDVQSAT